MRWSVTSQLRTQSVTGFFPPNWDLGAGIKIYEETKQQNSYPQGDVNEMVKELRGKVWARNGYFEIHHYTGSV